MGQRAERKALKAESAKVIGNNAEGNREVILLSFLADISPVSCPQNYDLIFFKIKYD
jgi:hypothetical protein